MGSPHRRRPPSERLAATGQRRVRARGLGGTEESAACVDSWSKPDLALLDALHGSGGSPAMLDCIVAEPGRHFGRALGHARRSAAESEEHPLRRP
jgi:hypothetical protein